MPLELKPPRLPAEWHKSGGEMENSPRLLLQETHSVDFPISGGWGYGSGDCVVIDKNDPVVPKGLPFDGVSIEYDFFLKRCYAELIIFRHPRDRFSGIEYDLIRQNLKEIDGRKFDVLKCKVTALLDRDWEALKHDWESNDGYKDDEEGREKHLEERHLRTCSYETECWFDITSFYGQ